MSKRVHESSAESSDSDDDFGPKPAASTESKPIKRMVKRRVLPNEKVSV